MNDEVTDSRTSQEHEGRNLVACWFGDELRSVTDYGASAERAAKALANWLTLGTGHTGMLVRCHGPLPDEEWWYFVRRVMGFADTRSRQETSSEEHIAKANGSAA